MNFTAVSLSLRKLRARFSLSAHKTPKVLLYCFVEKLSKLRNEIIGVLIARYDIPERNRMNICGAIV